MKKKKNEVVSDIIFQALFKYYGIKDVNKISPKQLQEIIVSITAMLSSLGISIIKTNPNLKDQSAINDSANQYMEAVIAIMQDSFQTHVGYTMVDDVPEDTNRVLH